MDNKRKEHAVMQQLTKNPKRVAAGKMGGRPATRRESNRTVNVQFRLSEEEKNNLQRYARSLSMSMGDYIVSVLAPVLDSSNQPTNGIPLVVGSIPVVISDEEAKQLFKTLTTKLFP